jgi:hypothetical protein
MNEGMTGDVDNDFYAFKDWVSVRVESISGEMVSIDSANYHIYDDLMLFVHKGQLFLIYPDQINRIYAENKTFTSYKNEDNNYNYFEIIAEGEFQLLKKYKIAKEKVMDNPMGISHGNQEYKYTQKANFYYYNTLKDEIAAVPKKKNELIKIFSRNKSKMLNFARDNKLNSKSETDLIKMFNYYNQLN